MISIEIDGEVYHVEEGSNLLQTCLSLGLDLPYFCWHPSLGSVGACRQCALIQYQDRHDDEGDERDEIGRIVMGCMTPVTDGMRLSLSAQNAVDFRASNIEFLMTNHPHDCPVCEEGGECHLQDMTVMTGHTMREYRGLKRTHRNQYLGPFINHEMNRCIACYRCVRFYDDYAGGGDLQVQGAHHHVYFGRHEDGVLENPFSGNLVEVCPTGVFTDKTLSSRYSRKWDIQAAPSICMHCAQGCNISPGERYGELRRVVNRYNSEVNGYFLCDRGRFGYGYVNRDNRPLNATQYTRDAQGQSVAAALDRSEVRDKLADAVSVEKTLIGIGSPRASLEANFALRELVGADNFYSGVSPQEDPLVHRALQIYKSTAINIPSLKEVEQCDAILVLGEDVLNTSPRLALSLRQAVRNEALELADQLNIPRWQDAAVREAAQADKSPLFNLAYSSSQIDDIATLNVVANPAQLVAMGQSIVNGLDSDYAVSTNLDTSRQEQVTQIVDALKNAQRPLIVSGCGACSEAILNCAANIAMALSKARANGDENPTDLFLCLPEANSLGLAMLLDQQVMQSPAGKSLAAGLQRASSGNVDTCIVLENDLSRRVSDELVQAAAEKAEMVRLDYLTPSAEEMVGTLLPAAPSVESEGTLVSSEGRAQRYYPVYVCKADVRPSWEWLSDMIALRAGKVEPRWQQLDAVTQDCASTISGLSAIVDAAPAGDFRMQGMKIARQPHRYSGRTAMLADTNVSEPKQPEDTDSPLGFTMEGFPGEKPASLAPYYWSPGWNSNQSVGKFQEEAGGALKGGDPGVRLLDTAAASTEYFDVELPADAAPGEWLLLPQHQMFGSEELSNQAAPIVERGEEPSLWLNPKDAAGLGIEPGNGVKFESNGRVISLMLQANPKCASGTALVTSGSHRTAGLTYLSGITLSADSNWHPEKPQVIVSDQPASAPEAQA